MTEELTKIIEDAKSGRTADLIRSLDLSTEEGAEKLKTILAPFSNYGKGVRIPHEHLRANRILDRTGNPLFPFECTLSTPEHLLADYPLGLTEMLKRMGDKEKLIYPFTSYNSPLEKHLSVNGHEISKVPYIFSTAFGIKKDRIIEDQIPELLQDSASDDFGRFLAEMYVGGELVALSLNGSLPHYFISSWEEDKRYPPRPEHPNSHSVIRLLDFNERYFKKWNQAFLSYLSHIIQNPNYKVPRGSRNISKEQIIADSYCTGIRGYVFSQGKYMHDGDWSIYRSQKERGRGSEYCEDIEEEVNLMLAHFVPYEQSLDKFLEAMGDKK